MTEVKKAKPAAKKAPAEKTEKTAAVKPAAKIDTAVKAAVKAAAPKAAPAEPTVVKAAPAAKKVNTPAFAGTYVFAIGKRKTAVARMRMYPAGGGTILVNRKPVKEYFTVPEHMASFMAPFVVSGIEPRSYDISIDVAGSGIRAHADACRHALARALEKENKDRRVPLKQAGFLTRDSRIKERKKPGLKGARRAPQWAKR